MMGNKAQKKSEQTNWDHQKALIYNALREMSPENIQHLQSIFLPMIQSKQALSSQTALHGLMRAQARSGLAGSRLGAGQLLGFQAAQGNNALQQAFQQAFGVAGQRAGIWSGAQVPQTQPNYNMANALGQGSQQALLAYALSGRNQPQMLPAGTMTSGNWGLPSPATPPTYGYGQVY